MTRSVGQDRLGIKYMLRSDELTAWNGFRAAVPGFAGEEIIKAGDGPDPPDVLATSLSGKTIGVEITKWVEHEQVTAGRGRELLENSYLDILASENEPRPGGIGWVWLHDRSARVKTEDATEFRNQLFELLTKEDAALKASVDEWDGGPSAVPAWNTAQGAPVTDFSGLQKLEKYLADVWIFPRYRLQELSAGHPWVFFEAGAEPTHRNGWYRLRSTEFGPRSRSMSLMIFVSSTLSMSLI